MYCIKCGVKLADTEKKGPLCHTIVCHPDFEQTAEHPFYPENKMPKSSSGSKALNGAILILFFIPLLVCFFADWSLGGRIEWFGYVAGALALSYIIFALPIWFKKPNPVIFVPCDFVACALYLLYIDLVTGGNWFMTFAFPVVGGICLITCTVVTLMRYIHRGKLYIFGGAFMVLGTFMLLIEYLLSITFALNFIGWSIYPLVVLLLFGGMLIFLGINSNIREKLERRFFF